MANLENARNFADQYQYDQQVLRNDALHTIEIGLATAAVVGALQRSRAGLPILPPSVTGVPDPQVQVQQQQQQQQAPVLQPAPQPAPQPDEHGLALAPQQVVPQMAPRVRFRDSNLNVLLGLILLVLVIIIKFH